MEKDIKNLQGYLKENLEYRKKLETEITTTFLVSAVNYRKKHSRTYLTELDFYRIGSTAAEVIINNLMK